MAINGSSINRVAINDGDNITLTPSLSVTSTSTSSITTVLKLFRTLIYAVTSTATINKTYGKALNYLSTTSITIGRAIKKLMSSITEMSVIVLTESAFHLALLSVTVVSTATLSLIHI